MLEKYKYKHFNINILKFKGYLNHNYRSFIFTTEINFILKN